MRDQTRERARLVARYAAALVFIPFGILHCAASARFLPIMPPFVPYPQQVVVATGIAEILGGIGILLPPTRKAAGIGLALYAIGVYPANVYHAFAHVHVPPLPDSWWYHGPRLLAQPLIVWWALFAGDVLHRTGSSGASGSGGGAPANEIGDPLQRGAAGVAGARDEPHAT